MGAVEAITPNCSTVSAARTLDRLAKSGDLAVRQRSGLGMSGGSDARTGRISACNFRRRLCAVRALAERYGAWDFDLTTRLGIPAEDLLSFQHDYRVEVLRARYGGPPSIMLLVSDAGFPAACGAVDLSHPPHAELKTLYVAPEARGRGLGSQILQRLLAEAQARALRMSGSRRSRS